MLVHQVNSDDRVDRIPGVRADKGLRARKQLSEDQRSLQIGDQETHKEELITNKILRGRTPKLAQKNRIKLISSQHRGSQTTLHQDYTGGGAAVH